MKKYKFYQGILTNRVYVDWEKNRFSSNITYITVKKATWASWEEYLREHGEIRHFQRPGSNYSFTYTGCCPPASRPARPADPNRLVRYSVRRR